MDILSDVLRVVRLSGAVIFVTESSSPWAIISPAAQALAPANMPNAECFTLFHVLAEGECWVEIKGELPVKMGSGDVVVLPQGDEHVMASDLSLKPVSMRHLVPELPRPGMPPLIHGGGGKGARFVCGYLHCDQRFNYLFGSLAKLLCVHS